MWTKWLQFVLMMTLFGVSKAHGHLIKLIVLAALGLCGLWLLQHSMQQQNCCGQGGGGGGKYLFKRSLNQQEDSSRLVNWTNILASDPVGCARSFLCQLVAKGEDVADDNEKIFIRFSRLAIEGNLWPVEFTRAVEVGKKVGDPMECLKIYKYCPYSSGVMLKLLRFFGG